MTLFGGMHELKDEEIIDAINEKMKDTLALLSALKKRPRLQLSILPTPTTAQFQERKELKGSSGSWPQNSRKPNKAQPCPNHLYKSGKLL